MSDKILLGISMALAGLAIGISVMSIISKLS